MSISSLINDVAEALTKDNLRFFWVAMLLICFGSIGLAFFTEFVLGYEPCILCLYQRIPYFLIFMIGCFGIRPGSNGQLLLNFTIFSVLFGLGVSGYHSGVERELWAPSEFCVSHIDYANLSLDELSSSIYDMPIATCSKPPFTVFYLSMTEWNFLFSIDLLVITSYVKWFSKKRMVQEV